MALFRRDLPAGARWIEHGPKLSLGVLSRARRGDAQAIAGLVTDVCRREQRACSSVQALLVEGDDSRPELMDALAGAFQREALAHPPAPKSTDAQIEMLKVREVARVRTIRG